MKKILICSFVTALALVGFSCMHDCNCVTSYQFISPGNYISNVDTTNVPSRDDCSLMNTDTTYYIYSFSEEGDTLGYGTVVEQTICE